MGQNGQVIRISLQKWPPIFPQQRVFLGGLSGNNCRVLGGSQSHWVAGSRWGRGEDKDQFTKMVANSSAAPLCAPTLWSYPSLLPCRQRHPDRRSIVRATKLWSPIKTKSPTRPSVDQARVTSKDYNHFQQKFRNSCTNVFYGVSKNTLNGCHSNVDCNSRLWKWHEDQNSNIVHWK